VSAGIKQRMHRDGGSRHGGYLLPVEPLRGRNLAIETAKAPGYVAPDVEWGAPLAGPDHKSKQHALKVLATIPQ